MTHIQVCVCLGTLVHKFYEVLAQQTNVRQYMFIYMYPCINKPIHLDMFGHMSITISLYMIFLHRFLSAFNYGKI